MHAFCVLSPDCFMSPKKGPRSRKNQELIQMMPAAIEVPSRNERLTSRVQMVAASPARACCWRGEQPHPRHRTDETVTAGSKYLLRTTAESLVNPFQMALLDPGAAFTDFGIQNSAAPQSRWRHPSTVRL